MTFKFIIISSFNLNGEPHYNVNFGSMETDHVISKTVL